MLFTGPECSGKSTMTAWCGEQYNGVTVPEYARIYLDNLNRNYEFEDLLSIANQQLELESVISNKGGYVFCDTSLLVIHIWMMEKYDKSLWQQGFDTDYLSTYNLIFLCNPDIPWESDPQRENPMDRMRLYESYSNELLNLGLDFIPLLGSLEERKQIVKRSISLKELNQ